MLELLCVLYFNEAITEHSLKTVFNNNNQSLQWSNLSLASAHNESDIFITVSPYVATLHTIPSFSSQQVTVSINCNNSNCITIVYYYYY